MHLFLGDNSKKAKGLFGNIFRDRLAQLNISIFLGGATAKQMARKIECGYPAGAKPAITLFN